MHLPIRPSSQSLQNIQQYHFTHPIDALIPTSRDQELIKQFNAEPRELKEKFFLSATPPKPIKIYKYLASPYCFENDDEISTKKERLEKILIDHELYLSSHTQFNDPFDVFPSYKTDVSGKEIQASVEKSFKRLHHLSGKQLREATRKRLIWAFAHKEKFINETISGIRSVMEKVGIFCFTTNAENILMWSHYAFNHQGICLEFDLVEELHLSHLLFKVIYDNTRPQINPMIEVKSNDFDLNLLRKAESWKYEDEWRLIAGRQSGQSAKFGKHFLKSVIVGAKASDSTRHYLQEINEKRIKKDLPPLEIKQARLCPTEYKIIT
ncbi:DUF2971 domain-containing protein [Chromobacterium violaceum]|uniref:DUF2971 domain-containing protein n=1 Tax=Chromobacterium violaceum TaxID=536 RepID=UPI001B329FAA|nr:DUF2971 domain-containing protein [Chromobacterium violaceum]MBP4052016.1 DUF2971 domain-containing protein [Chromobacterium violaceum]